MPHDDATRRWRAAVREAVLILSSTHSPYGSSALFVDPSPPARRVARSSSPAARGSLPARETVWSRYILLV